MSSSRKRFHLKHPVVVDIGCSCRKSKLSSLFFSSSSSSSLQKQRKSHKYTNLLSPSTTSLTTSTYTNSSFSPFNATSSPSQAFYSPKQSTTTNTSTSTSTSTSSSKSNRRRKSSKKKGGVVEESVAVEKESSDPYIDFRDSMLQMIVEKEIYNWDDLRELLHLFLSLNSPYHHHLILQAFTEIWNGVFLPGR